MDIDYQKLGLKIGLELHQQLNTKKLFCNCSSEMKESEKKFEIRRSLRPAVGEMGKVDPAALFEFIRNRSFEYHGFEGEACLVDTDDEPPRSVNEEALRIATGLALIIGLSIPSEIHVMRKNVLDGSAITSFQRTMLVGYGSPAFDGVRIRTLCLEEDASRPIESSNGAVKYSLSRLGIPLIELATEPDIKSPEQCLEIAQKLGLLFRSFNVKRGIGTIRQDVNVSIREGARVEIKGWQDLKTLPALVRNEAMRQASLVEISKKMQEDEKHFRGAMEISDIIGFECCVIKIPGIVGLSETELCKGKTLLDELFEYPKAYGADVCVAHGKLEGKDFEKLRNVLSFSKDDMIIIVYGKDYKKAALALEERVRHLWKGVPEETRKPNPDGTSCFARPLPGSERMYPETDCMPVIVTKDFIDTVRFSLPKTLLERKSELEQIMPAEIADQLMRSKYFNIFEDMAGLMKTRETLLAMATIFTSTMKDMERSGFAMEKIGADALKKIFIAIDEKKIPSKSVAEILLMVSEGKEIDLAIAEFRTISSEELEQIIDNAILENPGKNHSSLMGIIMSRAKGKADGKSVIEMLKRKLPL